MGCLVVMAEPNMAVLDDADAVQIGDTEAQKIKLIPGPVRILNKSFRLLGKGEGTCCQFGVSSQTSPRVC